MALDGIFLHFLTQELQSFLGARVDKIVQPSREEVILHLRGREASGKLLLSGGAAAPRVHFMEDVPENPKTPPMFCMLLRKRLGGGRLTGVKQMGLDRILRLEFEARNELGDPVTLFVILEIMGRHSNLIVTEEDGKIIDAIRRVDITTSRVRQVLPGMTYVLPPSQNKISLLEVEPFAILERLRNGREVELSKALMEHVEGFSQLVCREAAHFATRGGEVLATQLTPEQAERLSFYLAGVAGSLEKGTPTPTMILEPDGRPKDFCCLPVHQYGVAMITRDYPNCSSLLESFYADRERMERVRQRSGDLLNLLAATFDRITRKLAYQREELIQCADREQLRQKGDLISANLYHIRQGDTTVRVENFYHPGGEELEIELDPRLTPVQNAQRYYAGYRKADTAEKYLKQLITQGEEELTYVDSVFDALTRADGETELDTIRQELRDSGYLRRSHRSTQGKKQPKIQKLPYLRYRSSDGYLILCGRNNLQNDRLTSKEAEKQDLWLHTQKIPGSHVIIRGVGEDIPNATLEEAAAIAAYNSKGRASSKVPVDYTRVRNVRKPNGSKPGMVIYETYHTILAEPDEELVRSLEEK